ncbi:MAG: 3-phosphoglycerate dehydrogenase family protein [Candidatus Paceibacterota bacterium]|jgi:D-3-phosphoglycerate dehydrogenase
MNRILVLNNVSKKGLALFGDAHRVGQDTTDPEGIIVRSAKVNTDQYPHLVAVARAGAGVNNVSVARATEKGVCVFNTPGANANAVAELVFIMLGNFARHVDEALRFVRSLDGDDLSITDRVEAEKSTFAGFELVGKTLGVIGLGKIGVLVANAGIKRSMRVIGHDAFPTFGNMHQLDSRVEVVRKMEGLLSEADVLSVHVPLSEKTKHLIGVSQVNSMKDEVILMNYAREGIYDDAAVIDGLRVGKVRAFITDFPTRALLEEKGVICTPHLGASTAESEENCAVMAAKQLKNYLEYGVVTNSVNFPTIETFPAQGIRARLAIVNKDMPGMIAVIAGMLGDAGINIQALTNESAGGIGYNLVDLGIDVGDELVSKISAAPNILRVRVLRF